VAKHLHLEVADYGLELMQNRQIRLKMPKLQGERTLVCFAILSWYLPEITRWEVQEYLRKKTREHNILNLESYLQTKELMLFCLYREYDYTHNDLFGNILVPRGKQGEILPRGSNKQPLEISLYLCERPKPKTTERKRGYTDHGSAADISVRARKEANQGTYEEQLEIELRRSTRELTIRNFNLQRILELRQGVT
jgi:hypothetical protein